MLATNSDFYYCRCSNCKKWRKVSAINYLCDSCEYIRQAAPNLVVLAERPAPQRQIRPVAPSRKKSTRVSAISKILDLLTTGPKTTAQIIQALDVQDTTVTSALWRALRAGKLVKQEFDRKGISSL